MKKSLIKKSAVGLLLVALLLSGCAAPEATEEEQLFVGYSGPTQLDNFQIVLTGWDEGARRGPEVAPRARIATGVAGRLPGVGEGTVGAGAKQEVNGTL